MATRIVTVRSDHEKIRVDGQRANRVLSVRQDHSKLQTPAVPVSWKVPPNDLPDIQHPNACSRKVPRNVPISTTVRSLLTITCLAAIASITAIAPSRHEAAVARSHQLFSHRRLSPRRAMVFSA